MLPSSSLQILVIYQLLSIEFRQKVNIEKREILPTDGSMAAPRTSIYREKLKKENDFSEEID